MNFFHRLFNPHCPDCKLDKEDAKVNIAIEILRSELAAERYNNQLLINSLLPKPEQHFEEQEPKIEINKSQLRWGVRQQMLEAEDRALAHTNRRIKKEKEDAEKASAKTTEELEKELELGE